MATINVPVECAIHARMTTGIVLEGIGWCDECELRRELWIWGARHQWPEISTGTYAIWSGKRIWLLATAFADEERIAELASYAYALEEDELTA